MRKCGWAIVAAAMGCSSAAMKDLEDALAEAAACESRGQWAEAVAAYDRALPASGALGKEQKKEIEHRAQAAFQSAWNEIAAAEARANWTEVLRQGGLIRTAANRYGQLTRLEAILIRAEIERAVAQARAQAAEADYTGAWRSLLAVRELARRNQRGEEIDRIAREMVHAGLDRAKELASGARWKECVDVCRNLLPPAGPLGLESEVQSRLRSAREQLVASAVQRGDDAAGANKWPQAVLAYEEALTESEGAQRGEIERKLRIARLRSGLAAAEPLEASGRFEEAIAALAEVVRQAAGTELEAEASERLRRCRDAWCTAAVRRIEERMKAGLSLEALALAERVRPQAVLVGREAEFAGLAREARTARFRQALAEARERTAAGRFEEAYRAVEEARGLAAELGDSEKNDAAAERTAVARAQFRWCLNRAKTCCEQQLFDEAARAVEQAKSIAGELGESERNEIPAARTAVVRAHLNACLAQAERSAKRSAFDEAYRLLDRAESLARDLGEEEQARVMAQRTAVMRSHLDNCLVQVRRCCETESFDQAYVLIERARSLCKGIGADEVEVNRHWGILRRSHYQALLQAANRCRSRDQFEEAFRHLDRAMAIAREIGQAEVDEVQAQISATRRTWLDALLARADALERQERWPEAEQAYQEALKMFRGSELERAVRERLDGMCVRRLDSLFTQARGHEKLDRWAQAASCYDQALPLARRLGREAEWRRLSRHARDRAYGGGIFYDDFDLVTSFDLRGEVTAAALSGMHRTGQYLGVCTKRGDIVVWNTETWRQEFSYDSGSQFFDLAFSPDREYVAGADSSGRVRVWDIRFNVRLDTLRHQVPVYTFDYSPDGGWIVTGAEDGKVRLWRWSKRKADGDLSHVFEGHQAAVKLVRFVDEGRRILSVSADGEMRLWEVAKRECAKTVKAHEGGCRHTHWDEARSRVITTGHNHKVRSWSVSQWAQEGEIECEGAEVVVVDGTGRYLISGDGHGRVRLWDPKSGKCCKTFSKHTAPIVKLLATSDGRFLISVSRDGQVCVWGGSG